MTPTNKVLAKAMEILVESGSTQKEAALRLTRDIGNDRGARWAMRVRLIDLHDGEYKPRDRRK